MQTDVPTREVRFNLKERGGFNAEEVQKALTEQGFPEMTVKAAPKE